MYGRQAEIALAAVTRLAEVYDGGRTRLSAAAVARDKGLRAPFVAKLLTAMARAGVVVASPGPGGGYALARAPGAITVHEVVGIFERGDRRAPHPPESGRFIENLRSLHASWDDLARRTTLESLLGRRDATKRTRGR